MSLFSAPAGADPLGTAIKGVVRAASAGAPRSRQRTIGPSSAGHPCARRVGYELAGTEHVNASSDPWPAIVGTAVHAWLADAFAQHNRREGRDRWLVEQRVAVTPTMSGTADLFDTASGTVIDHKVLGADSLKSIKRDGPGQQYRTQIHLYGYGLARAGHDVRRVALACYPRSGFLDGLHVWSEDYDDALAADALARLAGVAELSRLLDPAALPAEPGAGCTWCPFWRPGGPADAAGCPGAATA
ncbi:PD-(D/E)XK nuclease family protein [Longispora albida]|uniref:PD-(D/E)XK nuclease family protein n=1 Tax=Longispora albida TaxID=203523 RepID=UPI00037BCBA0|nr:PD-(D/E)XK nuclease family protein [Longispora albida]